MTDGSNEMTNDNVVWLAKKPGEPLPVKSDPTAIALGGLLSTAAAKEAYLNLAKPFQMRADGLHIAVTKTKNEVEDVRVCAPILVVA
jgi:hypothetical protein